MLLRITVAPACAEGSMEHRFSPECTRKMSTHSRVLGPAALALTFMSTSDLFPRVPGQVSELLKVLISSVLKMGMSILFL